MLLVCYDSAELIDNEKSLVFTIRLGICSTNLASIHHLPLFVRLSTEASAMVVTAWSSAQSIVRLFSPSQ